MKTYYGSLCAWFYDIDKPFAPKDELKFYMSYLKQNMTILEPMCGSGRFMTELIKAGYLIDGFDLSADMINRCKEKIKNLPFSGHLECCDFSHFQTNKLYDCIYIPACSFSLFIEDKQIYLNLVKLKKLLKPNGKLLLAVLTDLDYREDISVEKIDQPRKVQENGIEIILNSKTSYNSEYSFTYSQMIYELYENNRFIRSEQEDFYIKRYREGEFEMFSEDAKLFIENKFINYNKEAFNGQDTEINVYVLSNKE